MPLSSSSIARLSCLSLLPQAASSSISISTYVSDHARDHGSPWCLRRDANRSSRAHFFSFFSPFSRFSNHLHRPILSRHHFFPTILHPKLELARPATARRQGTLKVTCSGAWGLDLQIKSAGQNLTLLSTRFPERRYLRQSLLPLYSLDVVCTSPN